MHIQAQSAECTCTLPSFYYLNSNMQTKLFKTRRNVSSLLSLVIFCIFRKRVSKEKKGFQREKRVSKESSLFPGNLLILSFHKLFLFFFIYNVKIIKLKVLLMDYDPCPVNLLGSLFIISGLKHYRKYELAKQFDN